VVCEAQLYKHSLKCYLCYTFVAVRFGLLVLGKLVVGIISSKIIYNVMIVMLNVTVTGLNVDPMNRVIVVLELADGCWLC